MYLKKLRIMYKKFPNNLIEKKVTIKSNNCYNNALMRPLFFFGLFGNHQLTVTISSIRTKLY